MVNQRGLCGVFGKLGHSVLCLCDILLIFGLNRCVTFILRLKMKTFIFGLMKFATPLGGAKT